MPKTYICHSQVGATRGLGVAAKQRGGNTRRAATAEYLRALETQIRIFREQVVLLRLAVRFSPDSPLYGLPLPALELILDAIRPRPPQLTICSMLGRRNCGKSCRLLLSVPS